MCCIESTFKSPIGEEWQAESNVVVIPDFSKGVGEVGRIEIVDEFGIFALKSSFDWH